jgi:hypothetical protein
MTRADTNSPAVKPCYRGHTAGRHADRSCKECKRERTRDNRERRNAQARARYATSSKRQRAHSWAWKSRHPSRVRDYRLKRLYRLTPDAYAALLSAQGGCCALCGDPFGRETPRIDHDHACCPGERSCGSCIRGLLHHRCNRGLGFFGDSPATLRCAAAYLESHRAATTDEKVA